MASSLLSAGRGAVRLLLRRAIPAAVSRPPVLQPGFDVEPEPKRKQEAWRKRLWDMCKEAASEPKCRPVLPLEMRYDKEQEVLILCRTARPYYVKYARGATDLVHSDLNKYWVPEVLQEIYTDIVTSQGMAAVAEEDCEFGKQMEATVQAFQKFGSLVLYNPGTCCVRDKDGRLSVVVDENFHRALLANPRYPGLKSFRTESTGYTLWTVSKSAFQCRAFKVVTVPRWGFDYQCVEFDADKFRVATGASEEEVRRAAEVKVAVEIKRSKFGQGKLVIFMPYASAKNRYEVFTELFNAGFNMRGLRLSRPPHTIPHVPQSVWYKLHGYEEESGDDD